MRDCNDFDKMFKEWYIPFFYFAFRYIKDREVCKDIVSESFEKLWKNYDQIDATKAKSYLASMVKTKCIDYLRHQSVHENYIKYTTYVNDSVLKEDDFSLTETRIALIRKGMEKLTPYNRHILEQCYIHHKKYKEVAEELQISVSAIHKNIVKALRILRNDIKNG